MIGTFGFNCGIGGGPGGVEVPYGFGLFPLDAEDFDPSGTEASFESNESSSTGKWHLVQTY